MNIEYNREHDFYRAHSDRYGIVCGGKTPSEARDNWNYAVGRNQIMASEFHPRQICIQGSRLELNLKAERRAAVVLASPRVIWTAELGFIR